MSKSLKEKIYYTKSFFIVRLLCAVANVILYFLMAAWSQYLFVGVFGENKFNYIVGGIISLLFCVAVCKFTGSILFMFIDGWHISALMYVEKIKKHSLSSLDVGFRVFKKYFISFGAVWALRSITKNVSSRAKDKLSELLKETSIGKFFADGKLNLVFDYIGNDILHYSFDSVICYIISLKDIDSSKIYDHILTGLKLYIRCLPVIVSSSIKTFLMFEFIPKICRIVLSLAILFTLGLSKGILILILLYPVSYLIDIVILNTLAMMVFIDGFCGIYKDIDDEDSNIDDIIEYIFEETSEKKKSNKQSSQSNQFFGRYEECQGKGERIALDLGEVELKETETDSEKEEQDEGEEEKGLNEELLKNLAKFAADNMFDSSRNPFNRK